LPLSFYTTPRDATHVVDGFEELVTSVLAG